MRPFLTELRTFFAAVLPSEDLSFPKRQRNPLKIADIHYLVIFLVQVALPLNVALLQTRRRFHDYFAPLLYKSLDLTSVGRLKAFAPSLNSRRSDVPTISSITLRLNLGEFRDVALLMISFETRPSWATPI